MHWFGINCRAQKNGIQKWGLPLNQFDLAMTNIAFSGVVLLGIRALAVFPNKHEVAQFYISGNT